MMDVTIKKLKQVKTKQEEVTSTATNSEQQSTTNNQSTGPPTEDSSSWRTHETMSISTMKASGEGKHAGNLTGLHA